LPSRNLKSESPTSARCPRFTQADFPENGSTGFILKGRIIDDGAQWLVPAAQIIYEGSDKKTLIMPKFIENDPANGTFQINCGINELIEVPKKKIEVYLVKGYKTSDFA